MIKRLLALLFLIPTLCFAKLGDTRDVVEYKYGNPVTVQVYSGRTQIVKYVDPDGDTLAVIMYYNGKSVAETYFSKLNKPFSTDYMASILRLYGEEWVLFSVEDPSCRCVKSGTFRVCYGPMPGTLVQHALTVVTTDAEAALSDVGPNSPYKKFSGLQL